MSDPAAGAASPRQALAPDAPLIRRSAGLLGIGILVCLLGYLAASIPVAWFPSAQRIQWSPADMAVTRGHGTVRGDELIATPTDPSGAIVVSLPTQFRSGQYPVIAWTALDIPDTAQVRLLWRTDYAPAKLNAAPMSVSAGRLLPVAVNQDPNWLGNVLGVALAIQGAPAQGVRIRGVVASPMGAWELVRERAREWLTFESWSGTSINTLAGGADTQDLPLPALLFTALVIGIGAWLALNYRRASVAALPIIAAVAFMIAWSLSDARWTWNLLRQVRATYAQYGGKSARERHLAAEDGPLYAFIERVRAKLPPTPVRMFVAAEAHYFRGRAAYHLYPNNVYIDAYANTLPAPSQMRPGDYFLIYQRRGVQFDMKEGRLRWDGNEPVRAEVVLVEPGAALFRLL